MENPYLFSDLITYEQQGKINKNKKVPRYQGKIEGREHAKRMHTIEDETILGSMISRITVIASLGDHKSHSGKIITLKKHINGQRKIDCTRPRNGDDKGIFNKEKTSKDFKKVMK